MSYLPKPRGRFRRTKPLPVYRPTRQEERQDTASLVFVLLLLSLILYVLWEVLVSAV